MKREEIENILKQNDSSVLSFKDRGPWGDNKYRGNCSGYVQASSLWLFHLPDGSLIRSPFLSSS